MRRLTGSGSPDAWEIGRRVGGTTDLWWQAGDGADREGIARDVIQHLRAEVIPFLDAAGTPGGFETSLREMPEPTE